MGGGISFHRDATVHTAVVVGGRGERLHLPLHFAHAQLLHRLPLLRTIHCYYVATTTYHVTTPPPGGGAPGFWILPPATAHRTTCRYTVLPLPLRRRYRYLYTCRAILLPACCSALLMPGLTTVPGDTRFTTCTCAHHLLLPAVTTAACCLPPGRVGLCAVLPAAAPAPHGSTLLHRLQLRVSAHYYLPADACFHRLHRYYLPDGSCHCLLFLPPAPSAVLFSPPHRPGSARYLVCRHGGTACAAAPPHRTPAVGFILPDRYLNNAFRRGCAHRITPFLLLTSAAPRFWIGYAHALPSPPPRVLPLLCLLGLPLPVNAALPAARNLVLSSGFAPLTTAGYTCRSTVLRVHCGAFCRSIPAVHCLPAAIYSVTPATTNCAHTMPASAACHPSLHTLPAPFCCLRLLRSPPPPPLTYRRLAGFAAACCVRFNPDSCLPRWGAACGYRCRHCTTHYLPITATTLPHDYRRCHAPPAAPATTCTGCRTTDFHLR